MPTSFEDVAAMCLALPEVVEGERSGRRTWFVGTRALAWERPLTKADIKRWGDDPLPEGEIVALATDDLAEKEAILAIGQKGFFTMQHFDGYPAFLIELRLAGKRALKVAIEDAWLAVAPDALAQDHLAGKKRR